MPSNYTTFKGLLHLRRQTGDKLATCSAYNVILYSRIHPNSYESSGQSSKSPYLRLCNPPGGRRRREQGSRAGFVGQGSWVMGRGRGWGRGREARKRKDYKHTCANHDVILYFPTRIIHMTHRVKVNGHMVRFKVHVGRGKKNFQLQRVRKMTSYYTP
jgi:hypothetical protein